MPKDSWQKKVFININANSPANVYNIHIGPLRFFGFHGIHEEEKILGNNFEVTLHATATSSKKYESLDDAVDYTNICEIIRLQMITPTPLLETIADNICNELFRYEDRMIEIQISIYKLNPPIMGINGRVGISLTKIRPA